MKLKFTTIVQSNYGLMGLDEKGQLWRYSEYNIGWTPFNMTAKNVCPDCQQQKDCPKVYVEPNGHGSPGQICRNSFHRHD